MFTGSSSDWATALGEALSVGPDEWGRPLRVLPLHNTQAHALTCSKRAGSLGHHFRVLGGGGDSLTPPLDATLAALYRFEWVGLTDLMGESLCLLHYQANGTLPPSCGCGSMTRQSTLGSWVETRSTYCLLFTAHCLLLTAYCSLLSAYYLLLTTCCLLLTTCYLLLPASCFLLPTSCSLSTVCSLLATYDLLLTVDGLLLATCCMLLAAYYLLLATHCVLLTADYLLLATCGLRLIAFCLLLATCY